MATKKDIKYLKASLAQINTAISDIRDHVIQILLNENTKLKSRVKQLEIDLAQDQQYHRRSNIVISGIPKYVEDIESTVIIVLNTIKVPVKKRSIESVHRIRKDKELSIVRYISRRDAETAIANRLKLKEFDAALVDFEEGTKINFQQMYQGGSFPQYT